MGGGGQGRPWRAGNGDRTCLSPSQAGSTAMGDGASGTPHSHLQAMHALDASPAKKDNGRLLEVAHAEGRIGRLLICAHVSSPQALGRPTQHHPGVFKNVCSQTPNAEPSCSTQRNWRTTSLGGGALLGLGATDQTALGCKPYTLVAAPASSPRCTIPVPCPAPGPA